MLIIFIKKCCISFRISLHLFFSIFFAFVGNSYIHQVTGELLKLFPFARKGTYDDPGNYRTVSLTKMFRKLLERRLHPLISIQSPILDLAQDGFREARGSLDQELCLAKICNILRQCHHISPVLAFLGIKSAYATVDCYVI